MPLALREFRSRLVRSGITEANGWKQVAAAFSETHSGKPPETAAELAAFLVGTGLLTDYQSGMLLGEAEPALRLGGFVIRQDRPIRPLTHWIPVQTVVSEEGHSTRRGFLLRVPLTALDGTMQTWLRTHAKISASKLQPIELSGGASAADNEKTVEIFSPVATGQSLWQRLGSDPMPPRQIVRIGIEIAQALVEMHSVAAPSGVPLAHGAVGCDHVWITEKKGNVVLLRDPSSGPRSPHDDPALSWIERIEPTAAYAAPELAEVGAVATPQSDVYSLGCVLYTALLGQRPFVGNENAKLIQKHRFEVPDPLREAAEKGADGDPILRVLAYAMAKDPAARFPTANAFADALQKVKQLLPVSDSSLAMKRAEPAPPSAPPAQSAAPPAREAAKTLRTRFRRQRLPLKRRLQSERRLRLKRRRQSRRSRRRQRSLHRSIPPTGRRSNRRRPRLHRKKQRHPPSRRSLRSDAVLYPKTRARLCPRRRSPREVRKRRSSIPRKTAMSRRTRQRLRQRPRQRPLLRQPSLRSPPGRRSIPNRRPRIRLKTLSPRMNPINRLGGVVNARKIAFRFSLE